MAMERIREIEKIIDKHHVGHSFFHRSRRQALFDILRILEDGCRLSLIARMQKSGDPSEADYFIRVFLNAANIAIKWLYSLCSENSDDDISLEFSEETGSAALDLILNYASPYCAICSGYISYSRKRITAQIDEKTNTVTFLSTDARKSMFCADIAEAFTRRKIINNIELDPNIIAQLESSIHIEDGRIRYNYNSDTLAAFRQFAQAQWGYTETLPETWTFDSFSLKDYKKTWITIATLCYIHSFACMKSNTSGMAVEDAVILIDEVQFVKSIADLSGVRQETVLKIIQYITYNNALKNNDIIYQPIFKFKDKLAITPYLFMSSRPERNLISLISKMSDAQYSVLTNTLEVLMQDDINRQLEDLKGIIKVRNIHLALTFPDVDYGIFDPRTNSAIICELKWLNESDSTQEVFAREDDIEHGCDQIKKIMASAIVNVPAFIEKVFNVESKFVDLFYCVISKNSIRSVSDDVPVISLNKFIEILKKSDINNGFHAIRNRDYYEPIPENSQMDSEPVTYAGYTFNIPALITYLS